MGNSLPAKSNSSPDGTIALVKKRFAFFDKSGKTPYYEHLLRVKDTVSQFYSRDGTEEVPQDVLHAALLHDFLEDLPEREKVSQQALEQELVNLGYSERVINMVKLLTKPESIPGQTDNYSGIHDEDPNRKQWSYNLWIEELPARARELGLEREVLAIKLADMVHNSSADRLAVYRESEMRIPDNTENSWDFNRNHYETVPLKQEALRKGGFIDNEQSLTQNGNGHHWQDMERWNMREQKGKKYQLPLYNLMNRQSEIFDAIENGAGLSR